jgi:hypothetical protein
MHGSAPGTRVYHREHRSKRGQQAGYKIVHRRIYKKKIEKINLREIDRDILSIKKKF